MRTSIILAVAALAGACNTADPLHTPGDDGEGAATDPAAFDIQPVFVANDSTSAVPVSATQAGDWNVDVTGTVAIANTDDSEAVPVRVVSGEAAAQTAQTPWVGGGQVLVPAGRLWASNYFYNVPVGKRLVIEYMTVSASVPAGQLATDATLLGSIEGTGVSFHFPLEAANDDSSARDAFAAVLPLNVNVSASVVVSFSRSASTGTALANFAMSGYLVDVPTP